MLSVIDSGLNQLVESFFRGRAQPGFAQHLLAAGAFTDSNRPRRCRGHV
jgi:hypothetical protein